MLQILVHIIGYKLTPSPFKYPQYPLLFFHVQHRELWNHSQFINKIKNKIHTSMLSRASTPSVLSPVTSLATSTYNSCQEFTVKMYTYIPESNHKSTPCFRTLLDHRSTVQLVLHCSSTQAAGAWAWTMPNAAQYQHPISRSIITHTKISFLNNKINIKARFNKRNLTKSGTLQPQFGVGDIYPSVLGASGANIYSSRLV